MELEYKDIYIERELWCWSVSAYTTPAEAAPTLCDCKGTIIIKPLTIWGIARRQKLCTESRSGKIPSGRKCEVKKHVHSYDVVVALVLSSLIVHLLFTFFSNFIYKMSEMFVEFCAHFLFSFLSFWLQSVG
jgi:hypothetical protein